MPKNEGTAHGRHYTEEEKTEDENRNYNRTTGRGHFDADEEQKAGGHSDRWADASEEQSAGRQHEFRDRDRNDDDENRHDEAQSEGGMQGDARNQGGHEGGRNQNNAR
jgi:hypothetical protein